MQHKERLDVLLVNRGLSESREKAKATIMAGLVFVDNQRVDKAIPFPTSAAGALNWKKRWKYFPSTLRERR